MNKRKKLSKIIASISLALTMCVSGVVALNSFNTVSAADPTITLTMSDAGYDLPDSVAGGGMSASMGTVDLRVNNGAKSIGSTAEEAINYKNGTASGIVLSAGAKDGYWYTKTAIADLSTMYWNSVNDYSPLFSMYVVPNKNSIVKYKQAGQDTYSYLPYYDQEIFNIYIDDAENGNCRLNLYTLVSGTYGSGVVNGTSQILLRYCNDSTGKNNWTPVTNIATVSDGKGGTLTGTKCIQVNHSFAGTSNKPLSFTIANNALYIANVQGEVYKIFEGINQILPSGKVKVTLGQGKQIQPTTAGAALTNWDVGTDATLVNNAPSKTSYVISALGGTNFSFTEQVVKVSDLTVTAPTYSAVDYGSKVQIVAPTIKYGSLNINTKKLVAKIGDSKLAFRGATKVEYYFYKNSTIEYYYGGVKVCESTIKVNKTGITIDETDIKKVNLATNSYNVAYGVEDLKYMGQLGGITNASRLRFDSVEDATNYTNGQKAGLVFTGGKNTPYYMQVQFNDQIDLSTLYYNSETDYSPLLELSSTPGTGIIKYKNNGVNDGDAEYSYAPYKTITTIVVQVKDALNSANYGLEFNITSGSPFENMYSNSCTSGITIKGNKNGVKESLTYKGRDGSNKTTEYYSYSFVGSQVVPFGITIANNALYLGECGIAISNHKMLDDVSEYFPSGKAIVQIWFGEPATSSSSSTVGSYGSDSSWAVVPETTFKTVVTAYGGKKLYATKASALYSTSENSVMVVKNEETTITAPTVFANALELNTKKLVAKIGNDELEFDGAESVKYTFAGETVIDYYYDGNKFFSQTVTLDLGTYFAPNDFTAVINTQTELPKPIFKLGSNTQNYAQATASVYYISSKARPVSELVATIDFESANTKETFTKLGTYKVVYTIKNKPEVQPLETYFEVGETVKVTEKVTTSQGDTVTYGEKDLRVINKETTVATDGSLKNAKVSGYVLTGNDKDAEFKFDEVINLDKLYFNNQEDLASIISFYVTPNTNNYAKYKAKTDDGYATDWSYLPINDLHSLDVYIYDAVDTNKYLRVRFAPQALYENVRDVYSTAVKIYDNTGEMLPIKNYDGSVRTDKIGYYSCSFSGTSARPTELTIVNGKLYYGYNKVGYNKATNNVLLDDVSKYFPSGNVKVGVKFVGFSNVATYGMHASYGVELQRLNAEEADITESSVVVSKLGGKQIDSENVFISRLDNSLSATYEENVFYYGKQNTIPSVEIVELNKFSQSVNFNCYSAKLYKENGELVNKTITYGQNIDISGLGLGKYYVEYENDYALSARYYFEIRPTATIDLGAYGDFINLFVNGAPYKNGEVVNVDGNLELAYSLSEGFEFVEFKLNGNVVNGTNVAYASLIEQNTIKLNATPISYSISYKMLEDATYNETGSYSIVDVVNGFNFLNPTAIEGKKFVGWYYDGKLVKSISDFDGLKDVTLYGLYDVVTYNVTFDINVSNDIIDGLSAEEYQAVINSIANQTVTNNGMATMQTPVVNGYKFVGWFTDEALTVAYDFTTQITSDVTLYAKWEKAPVVYGDTQTPDVVIEGEVIEPEAKQPTIFEKYTTLGVIIFFAGIGLGVIAIVLAVLLIVTRKKKTDEVIDVVVATEEIKDGGNNEN